MSMLSFTTLKSSLMKEYCVPGAEFGAGGQNCSVASDSESSTGLSEFIGTYVFVNDSICRRGDSLPWGTAFHCIAFSLK